MKSGDLQQERELKVTSEKRGEGYYSEIIPENVPCLLLSSFYVGEKKSVFLKFYNPSDFQVYFWSEYFLHGDAKNKHQPYCYVKKEFESEARQVVNEDKARYAIQKVKRLVDI